MCALAPLAVRRETTQQRNTFGCRLAWLFSALLRGAAWLLALLVALVAVPRAAALRGITEGEFWRRGLAAAAFGLINSQVLEMLKVAAFFGTGPTLAGGLLLARIRDRRMRMCVKQVLQVIHVPIAVVVRALY